MSEGINMGLDLHFEEAVTASEIMTVLKLTKKGLTDLEARGMPFIKMEEGHIYLTSSLLTFLHRVSSVVGSVT